MPVLTRMPHRGRGRRVPHKRNDLLFIKGKPNLASGQARSAAQDVVQALIELCDDIRKVKKDSTDVACPQLDEEYVWIMLGLFTCSEKLPEEHWLRHFRQPVTPCIDRTVSLSSTKHTQVRYWRMECIS